MFGRSEELAAVMAAWGQARAGSGRIIVVTGEGGVGKTRLIGEVERRVVGAGARAAVGAGVDVGGEAPLAIWHELARELVAGVPTPPPSAGWPAELGRLAPDLAAALGHLAVPPPVASPELERLRIFDAVLRLVEWAAAQRPLLLVAEDLHRADRASSGPGSRPSGLPARTGTPCGPTATPTSRCPRAFAPNATRAGSRSPVRSPTSWVVWQLAEAGAGTRIDVRVDLPDAEAFRLASQQHVIGESLANLGALAAAAASDPAISPTPARRSPAPPGR
jgi:hypothetical protein